jgi:hypothetical protein
MRAKMVTADNKNPLNCAEFGDCRDSFVSWIFFMIGLVATAAIRVVTVLMHLEPVYGKIAWYVGITGFLLFFIYKFRISCVRARNIKNSGLSEKIKKNEPLNCNDYEIIDSILCGLGSRKERINYFFIFFLSAVALLLALYIDFIR